jgi:UDP-N-acetylmuramoylalanine--D-glutamate ligase
MKLSGKQVWVLGLGRSGLAAARLLQDRGANVTLVDSAQGPALDESRKKAEAFGFTCLTGDEVVNIASLPAPEFAVLSPGIPSDAPIASSIRNRGIRLISEIEFAFQCSELPVVAITGTNGKTTTTLLVERMLRACGLRTTACGNIGLPASEVVLAGNSDLLTIEVSSFQLETIEAFRPRVAVWTNFSPNHLDRYRSLTEYLAAKARIFVNQTTEDHAIINAREQVPVGHAGVITFANEMPNADLHFQGDQVFIKNSVIGTLSNPVLNGHHNRDNLLAALGVCHALGLDTKAALAATAGFTPPEHRCEPVATIDGILYINDSKSTNLDATEKALRSFARPVILILGGKEKGFSFEPLLPLVLERVKQTIAIGQTADSIAATWQDAPCTLAATVEEAVQLSAGMAQAGDVVLFSPGTSSFDMFSGYEERGRVFKAAVQSLALKAPSVSTLLSTQNTAISTP